MKKAALVFFLVFSICIKSSTAKEIQLVKTRIIYRSICVERTLLGKCKKRGNIKVKQTLVCRINYMILMNYCGWYDND